MQKCPKPNDTEPLSFSQLEVIPTENWMNDVKVKLIVSHKIHTAPWDRFSFQSTMVPHIFSKTKPPWHRLNILFLLSVKIVEAA